SPSSIGQTLIHSGGNSQWQVSWEEPIMFETTKLGKYGTVTSTAEAARALIERWPFDTGL
ncbi:DUF982 domain-containing protein, partial [Shinella curvata]